MAGETPTQKIAALTTELARIDTTLNERSAQFAGADGELKAAIKDIEREVKQLQRDLSAVNEKCANLQRLSDRGWGLWQALLVLAISVAASVVTQFALRR